MKFKLLLVTCVLILSTFKVTSANFLNWNWNDYSNSSLLSESGDFTNPWWWWFRPEKRPTSLSFILLNHKPDSWISTYEGCAFNPNGVSGKKFTLTKSGISFEYYVYENVTLVAPVNLKGGKVVAQTKGPRITGGLAVCGVRYFPYGVPIKVTLPF